MAYTDMFNVGLDNLTVILETVTGLRVVNDPRNINPPCAFINAPTITPYNSNIAEMDVPVQIVGTGPSDYHTLRDILANVSKVMAAALSVTSAQPSTLAVGGQELPAYDLVIKMKVQGPWPA